jgi:hypothetical protein
MKSIYTIFIILWLAIPSLAFGCSCAGDYGYASDYIKGKTIFYGLPYKVELVDRLSNPFPMLRTEFSDVVVLQSKVKLSSTEGVKHHANGATCGTEFDLGHPSFVFASYDKNNDLVTGLCSSPSWLGLKSVILYLKTGQDYKLTDFHCGGKWHKFSGGEEKVSCDEWFARQSEDISKLLE